MIARLLTCLILTAFVTTLFCVAAYGQVTPSQGINLSGGTSEPESIMKGGFQDARQVIDVLLGRNTKGPYILSWKPIDQNSESIIVNGRRLERGVDYTIDYASGTLGFMTAIDEKSIIRAEYTRDPAKAVRNTGSLVVPLTYDLLNKQNSVLRFTGLYKQGDPNQPKTDLTVLGVTGETKSEAGQVSSTFLFTPSRSSEMQTDSSFFDQSAVKVGASTKNEELEIRGEYTRIGNQFAGAKEYKLKQGSEVTDLAAAYRLGNNITLSSKFLRAEDLMHGQEGETSQLIEHKIVVDPKDSTRLTLTRTETAKERNNSEVSTVTDRVQLEGDLSSRLAAVVTHENVATEKSNTESRLTTNQLELRARVAENVSAKTVATQRHSSETGSEAGVSVDVQATPSKALSVKMEANTTNTEMTGRDDRQALKVQATPSSNLNLEVGLARRDSESKGDEQQQSVKISSAPSSRVKVEMDYSNLDSQISGSEEKGLVRVVANPDDSIKISAAVGEKETPQQRDISKEARIEAKPFDHTTVGAGYKEVESSLGTVSRITEVTAVSKPTNFAEFSGMYKQRYATAEEGLDSVSLALKLSPGGPFTFVGSYVLNPEEKGVIQRLNSQTLGLQTDMGRLKLKSGYTVRDEYTIARRIESTEFGLDYRISARSLLTTSYRLDRHQEESVLDTSVYSLGFTHRLGSDFNLYLGGKLTTYELDRIYLEDKQEYQAEAKLGIRF